MSEQQLSAGNSLQYLFDRPTEPLFLPKDDVSFDVPSDYWNDRYKPFASAIQTRFPSSGKLVAVENVSMPDISLAASLDRRSNFSIFNPYHQKCATQLIELLMNMADLNKFLSACVYCRERVNPFLFIYAASVAMLHRKDTRGITFPSHVECFPELYLDGSVFQKAREEANIVPLGSRRPIEIPLDYTASDLDPEHRVAYWREDVGVNLHHWHWHLVFPISGPLEIVRKDRRGELFYYMHEQIMARYNFERLCNGLSRVKRFLNWREPIAEGYFPKMESLVSSKSWPGRQPNSILSNVNRPADQISVDIDDLERWTLRIYDAIHRGSVFDGQNETPLTDLGGIDVLGNMVESSILNINMNFYGSMHSMGHIMLGYIHDPDSRYLESFGTIGDPSTSMRDPVFYRWHATVDDIFQEHKNTLSAYTKQQIGFEGIRITSVEVIAEGIRINQFETFWQQNDIDLSRGLDFTPRGSLYARLTHLQHAPFIYRIQVHNQGTPQIGTVRIFIAPKFAERGVPFILQEQRLLFVELDKFSVRLRTGANKIERRSDQSSVTIPYEQTFRSLSNRPEVGGQASEDFNFCGCGWPQHMLIAKGTGEGFACELFTMVSNGEDDLIPDISSEVNCDNAQSYCGLRNARYPDQRSMGFPFDRPASSGANTLKQFLTPNMFAIDTRIRFSNRIVGTPPSFKSPPPQQGFQRTPTKIGTNQKNSSNTDE